MTTGHVPRHAVNRQAVSNGIRPTKPNGDLTSGEAVDTSSDTTLGEMVKHTSDVENSQNTIATAGDEAVVENTQSSTNTTNDDATVGDGADGICRSLFLNCMNAMLGPV